MTDEKPKTHHPFNIIHHRNDPNKAEFEGVPITRQKELYAGEWGLVRCTPYDNHFIFQIPDSRIRPGIWEHFCTCGSLAVIANPHDNKTKIFVCYFYHSRLLESGHGYHQTTVINKGDFPDIAGQTIELSEPPKWPI